MSKITLHNRIDRIDLKAQQKLEFLIFTLFNFNIFPHYTIPNNYNFNYLIIIIIIKTNNTERKREKREIEIQIGIPLEIGIKKTIF